MRLPRFTTRRLMVIVAIVAVILEGWIVWGRYMYHRDRAVLAMRVAAGLRQMMAKSSPARLARGTYLDFEDGSDGVPATPEACQRLLVYLERLARKHKRAASRPWLPVAPDLPEPK